MSIHPLRMRRRILLLITDLDIGGTPTVVRELARRLDGIGGAAIEVACLAGEGPVAEQIRVAGIVVTPLNAAGATDIGAIFRLIHLILRGRFDTVVSFLVHANAACAIARPFCPGVRWIHAIHTTQPRPRWHWWLTAASQYAAHKIIAPSMSVAAALQDWSHVPRGKIVVIPNAVDPADFELSPVPGQNPRPYPVGFIGRLDPVKRVGDLLPAIAQLGDLVHLHIFGYGAMEMPIRAAIERLSLQSRVTLHGSIAGPQSALARVGCLVLPSEAEGFGLVLIEAMAAGVPVIARDAPGIRDLITDGQNGLLVRDDRQPAWSRALAHAIARIVNEPPLRNSLIAGGRRSTRNFAWPAILQQYCRLLDLPEAD